MRKLYGMIIILFMALAITPFFSHDAQAQGLKIGFIKDDRIYQEYKAFGKAQEEWDLLAKAWDDEAASMQQELIELMDEFERQKLILSEEKKKEKEAQVNAKREALDSYTRQIYGPSGMAESKREQLVKPIYDLVTKAIEEVAIAENYDVIFTMSGGIGFIKETYDVTDKVLAMLDELEG